MSAPRHAPPRALLATAKGTPPTNLAGLRAPSFSFKCDTPPSANKIWRSVNGRAIKSKEYRDWLETAAWYVSTENKGRYYFYDKPLMVTIDLPKKHAASDLDNRIKPLLDALQAGGVIKNDNLIHEITARWRPKTYSDQTFAWVTVSEIQ